MYVLLKSKIVYVFYFFFFKQKTAYEMRISDWSSDVCSSDLYGNSQGWVRLARSPPPIPFPLPTRPSWKPPPATPRLRATRRSEERRVGKSVSVRVDLGGRRIIKKKKHINTLHYTTNNQQYININQDIIITSTIDRTHN